MRIAFVGCVDFSRRALTELIRMKGIEVCAVITRRSSKENSDFAPLGPIAESAGIPVLYVDADEREIAGWLKTHRPDYLFCMGWSRLLPDSVLRASRYGAIGFHPAKLPQHRGRHPLIWALALGLDRTSVTFFCMDERADGGPVLEEAQLRIGPRDDASVLYERVCRVGIRCLRRLVRRLRRGPIRGRKQDERKAGSWRKRSVADGRIDWRMSAGSLSNLVRALSRPYPGAHCDYRGGHVRIWKAAPMRHAAMDVEPGKVLVSSGSQLTVKCGEGALRIKEHEFKRLPKTGEYLS